MHTMTNCIMPLRYIKYLFTFRELYDKMRVFVQYMSSGEHERFIASIEREKELRFRLSELLRYRKLGLTTQEDIIHYEQHASFESQQQLKQKTVSSFKSFFLLSFLKSIIKILKNKIVMSTKFKNRVGIFLFFVITFWRWQL